MSSVSQWRDTNSVITWFENIKNKSKCIFMQYDIVEFCLSISEDLLKRAIESLYFSIIHIYKKEGNNGFDGTMGSFAGAVICEFVGLYVLYTSFTKYGRNLLGIYRDDGLACFENVSGPQADRNGKDFIDIFRKEFQLSIVCETNVKIVNFLDVTLDWRTGKYKPYNNSGNIPLYINAKSNHPSNIIKNVPESISVRMNKLSCDKSLFDNSKGLVIMHFIAVVLKIKSNLI